jgi:nitroreductase
MDVSQAISIRRSVRAYKPQDIKEEVLRKVLDAGRLATSANNVQPWKFIIVKDPATRERLAEAAS